MRILRINKKNINEAVVLLKAGGIVVYPTETAYALGCDATNDKAIAKIFKIKNRPKEKGLPVICATKKMASSFFKFGKIERKFAKKYWPGPLSIILSPCHCEESATWQSHQKRDCFASHFAEASRDRSLAMTAVRVSSNKTARAISHGLKRPVISTSANISGKKTLYDIKEIIREFENKKFQPDLILDGGKIPQRKPSTIIKIENNKTIVVRKGGIKI